MSDEIERVERVMKRASSRNSSHNDDPTMNRQSSRREDAGTLDARKALKESKHPITRICLTGGPCAGKTTALATLSVVLQ